MQYVTVSGEMPLDAPVIFFSNYTTQITNANNLEANIASAIHIGVNGKTLYQGANAKGNVRSNNSIIGTSYESPIWPISFPTFITNALDLITAKPSRQFFDPLHIGRPVDKTHYLYALPYMKTTTEASNGTAIEISSLVVHSDTKPASDTTPTFTTMPSIDVLCHPNPAYLSVGVSETENMFRYAPSPFPASGMTSVGKYKTSSSTERAFTWLTLGLHKTPEPVLVPGLEYSEVTDPSNVVNYTRTAVGTIRLQDKRTVSFNGVTEMWVPGYAV